MANAFLMEDIFNSNKCRFFYSSNNTEKKNISRFPQKIKRIVHFEINFWYVLAYLKGIQMKINEKQ